MTRPSAHLPFEIPDRLSWLGRFDGGRVWLDSLPDLLADAQDRFAVSKFGRPFEGGHVSLVVPVERAGTPAVLKLQFIDEETRHEADALAQWNGQGAICLLDHEPKLGALLLERCHPSALLADSVDIDRLSVLSDLLGKLLVPASEPFNHLTEKAGHWIASMEQDWLQAGKPCDKRLVEVAVSALSDLITVETDDVLLHQDLHGHNVLSAERSPWLVIDPKPLVGDPCFSLSPIVRSAELGHSKSEALYRLDRLSEELNLDRERARLWTIGQTMAWAFGSPNAYLHFDTVNWLSPADD